MKRYSPIGPSSRKAFEVVDLGSHTYSLPNLIPYDTLIMSKLETGSCIPAGVFYQRGIWQQISSMFANYRSSLTQHATSYTIILSPIRLMLTPLKGWRNFRGNVPDLTRTSFASERRYLLTTGSF